MQETIRQIHGHFCLTVEEILTEPRNLRLQAAGVECYRLLSQERQDLGSLFAFSLRV